MNSSDRVLARRYAQALFLAAAEGAQQENVWTELGEAYKALVPQFSVLKNPTVTAKDKKTLVQKAAPSLSSRTHHFLELLIDKKRIGLLQAIVADLGRIADENAGRVRAAVRSAADLSPAELQALSEKLKRFAGKDVVTETNIDSELLGGVVVRMGDLVLDGSIRGRLRNLAAVLVE